MGHNSELVVSLIRWSILSEKKIADATPNSQKKKKALKHIQKDLFPFLSIFPKIALQAKAGKNNQWMPGFGRELKSRLPELKRTIHYDAHLPSQHVFGVLDMVNKRPVMGEAKEITEWSQGFGWIMASKQPSAQESHELWSQHFWRGRQEILALLI